MLTKQWIEDNCFTVSNNLNNRSTIKSWWTIRGFDQQLQFVEDVIAENNYEGITQALYHIYHGYQPGVCKMCGIPTPFFNFKTGYRVYCSNKCVTSDPDRTVKIHAGRDYAKAVEKRRETCIERYGVPSTSLITVEKSRKTKLERYNNPHYSNPEKGKQTNLERYGVEYASLIPSKIQKTQQLRAEKLPLLRDKQKLKELNKTHTFAEIATMINVHETAVAYWFRTHRIKPKKHYGFGKSKPQEEIYQYCLSLSLDTINNENSILGRKDIDVYIPSKNLGIELNGLYWHKEKPTAHLDKTELCQSLNIRLLHFWDSEWYEKQDICKSIINSALGITTKIAARKCNVVNISNNEYREFCETNHIQGYAPASIRLGLEYQGQIVMVVGIGKSRYNKKYQYELVRSCSLLNHTVVGGFQRLLKHANVSNMISYCDRRFFTGSSYRQAGFKHLHNTSANYFYWNSRTGQVKSRIACQKHKLAEMLEVFDPELTEHQNMLNNNWYRVYDCGNMVWAL